MSQIKEHDLKLLMVLHIQMQSIIHTIDELQETTYYTREIKQKTNQFLNFIEPKINAISNKIDTEETGYYVECVKQLDDFLQQMTVEIEI